jgi:pyridoxal phosphate enzyme (YggS family)
MTITKNLTELTNRIEKVVKIHHRSSKSVQLLAVSKTWSSEQIRPLASAGQQAFGENYLQEALIKIEQLHDLNLTWHFIGPIQSNKTKDIAQNFDWVQSVDRPKIAQRLAAQRPAHLPPLNVCIQVNIDNEASKSGINDNELLPLAEYIQSLDNILLRGLMIIPSKTDDIEQQRLSFRKALTLFQHIATLYPSIDTLSMGMSNDMTLAIAEGSTMVRIGSALFGQRATPHSSGQVN